MVHWEILKDRVKRAKNVFLVARINDILRMKVRPPDRTYAEAAINGYFSMSLLYLSET